MQLVKGRKVLCLIIVILLTIFFILFHHVAGYLSHLSIYFHFFRIGLFFSYPLAQFPFLTFSPLLILFKKFIKSVFSFSLNVFPVEIKDRSTGGQIRELEINMVSS